MIRSPRRLLSLCVHLWHREPHQSVQHQWSLGAPCCPHFHHSERLAVRGGWSQHQWGQGLSLHCYWLIRSHLKHAGKNRCSVYLCVDCSDNSVTTSVRNSFWKSWMPDRLACYEHTIKKPKFMLLWKGWIFSNNAALLISARQCQTHAGCVTAAGC